MSRARRTPFLRSPSLRAKTTGSVCQEDSGIEALPQILWTLAEVFGKNFEHRLRQGPLTDPIRGDLAHVNKISVSSKCGDVEF